MSQTSAARQTNIGQERPSRETTVPSALPVLRGLGSGMTPGRLASGLLVLAVSAPLTWGIIAYWDLLVAMGRWGYLGVFASELISSASIFIPLPAHNYAMAMAITLDPYLLGLAGGIGAGLGEMTGYILGKAGKRAVVGGRWFSRFQSMAGRRFGLAVLAFAFMPAPIDFVGMLAGAAGYPAWRFLAIVCLGKVAKITLLTVAASYGLPLVMEYLS